MRWSSMLLLAFVGACTTNNNPPAADAGADAQGGGRASQADALPCSFSPPSVVLPASATDVLILFDRSESMGIGFGDGTRYTALTRTLTDLVSAYEQWIRFGYAEFPSQRPEENVSPECWTETPSVEVAPAHAGLVADAMLAALPLNGNTPTASALMKAQDYFSRLPDGIANRYVLLATDGLPDCRPSGKLWNSQIVDVASGSPIPGACQDAVTAVEQLAKSGVKVIVVGVGGDVSDNADSRVSCLNEMGRAGGAPRSMDGPTYYSANDPDELEEAIRSIFGAVARASCSLELPRRPTSPNLVHVLLDGQEIPRSYPDGWDFDNPNDWVHITLFGQYCEWVEQLRFSTVQVSYSCPAAPSCQPSTGCI